MDMKGGKDMFTKMAGECMEMMSAPKSDSGDGCKDFSKEKMEKMMAGCSCGPEIKEKFSKFMNNSDCKEKEQGK